MEDWGIFESLFISNDLSELNEDVESDLERVENEITETKAKIKEISAEKVKSFHGKNEAGRTMRDDNPANGGNSPTNYNIKRKMYDSRREEEVALKAKLEKLEYQKEVLKGQLNEGEEFISDKILAEDVNFVVSSLQRKKMNAQAKLAKDKENILKQSEREKDAANRAEAREKESRTSTNMSGETTNISKEDQKEISDKFDLKTEKIENKARIQIEKKEAAAAKEAAKIESKIQMANQLQED